MAISPLEEKTFDLLKVSIYPNKDSLGMAAAELVTTKIEQAIADHGVANIVFAAASSQLSFLKSLRELPQLPWPSVNALHMDEYLNLSPGDPAGFSLFLRRHLFDHVPVGAFFPMPGRAGDVEAGCQAYELLLRALPIDLCCLGIGENGHLAFNDPPWADFNDPRMVKVVELAEASRRQQVGEGHFASLNEVPTHAMTMTIPALRSAKELLCIVPESRKAEAVRRALLDPVSPNCPASILRCSPRARLLLDVESAQGLSDGS